MTTGNVMADILRHCLDTDKLAVKLFSEFSETSQNPEVKDFWRDMSCEEGTHVAFWQQLHEMALRGEIPGVSKSSW